MMVFDKLSKFLQIRADKWKWLAARDAYLEVVFKKVVKDNNLTSKLWQVTPFDPDNGSNDTAVCVRWKRIYPYVAGDPLYNQIEEKKAEISYNSISVMVHGSNPGDFVAKVYFIFSNEDGHMRSDIRIAQPQLKSTSTKAPIWFSSTLDDLYEHNRKFFK